MSDNLETQVWTSIDYSDAYTRDDGATVLRKWNPNKKSGRVGEDLLSRLGLNAKTPDSKLPELCYMKTRNGKKFHEGKIWLNRGGPESSGVRVHACKFSTSASKYPEGPFRRVRGTVDGWVERNGTMTTGQGSSELILNLFYNPEP